jgi:hypothetical protein
MQTHKGILKREKAQSFVEFALVLPVFLIMILGVTEFGFLLNQYLNVMDGPREGARYAANYNNCNFGAAGFYLNSASKANLSTDPIHLDPNHDDILVSIYSLYGSSANLVGNYSLYGHYPSRFSAAEVAEKVQPAGISGISPSPKEGIVLVEIFYNYHQITHLFTFMGDPLLVYSYTMMPCTDATP